MKQQDDLISIFIPVYNGEKYIAKTLGSILEQTYRNIEVLVVDDSSNDNSISIINTLAKKESRIKVFSKENGGNVPTSWKFILPHIKGNYIHYLSQDDIIDRDYIERLYVAITKSDAEIAIGNCVFQYDDYCKRKALPSYGIINGRDALSLSLNWTISGFGLYKTNLYRNVDIDTSIFNYDEYLSRLFFSKVNKVALVDTNFYYYQGNPNAITKSFKEYRFQGLRTSLLVNNLVLTFGKLEDKRFWIGQMINEIWNLVNSAKKSKYLLSTIEFGLLKESLSVIKKSHPITSNISCKLKIKYFILKMKYC